MVLVVTADITIDGVRYVGSLKPDVIEPPPDPPPEVMFTLYTRVSVETWPLLAPHVRVGDVLWGPDRIKDIALEARGLFITSADDLKVRDDASLGEYSMVVLRGDYKDTGVALAEADSIQDRLATYAVDSGRTVKFAAHYPTEFYDKIGPELVDSGPNVLLFGSPNWQDDDTTVASDVEPLSLQGESQRYIDIVTSGVDRQPGIVSYSGFSYRIGGVSVDVARTPAEISANIRVVASMGCVFAYEYEKDNVESLVEALKLVGRIAN